MEGLLRVFKLHPLPGLVTIGDLSKAYRTPFDGFFILSRPLEGLLSMENVLRAFHLEDLFRVLHLEDLLMVFHLQKTL